MSACDPSVVYFDAGDGPYYYLFYGGYGQIYVARSAAPDGPFAKYTGSGGWSTSATAVPVAIASPKNPSVLSPGKGWYGAGEPTVVVRNGELYMWYTDDTTNIAKGPAAYNIYQQASKDAIHWGSPQLTNVPTADSISVDVNTIPSVTSISCSRSRTRFR